MLLPGLRLDGDLSRLPWQPTSDPGVQWFPLHVEEASSPGPRKGGATVLIRMEPGRGYAPHRHLGGEDVLVLSGGYRDERGEYRQGEHVHYPPGSEHAPVALGDPHRPASAVNQACVLFAVVPLGIELVPGRAT